MSRTWLDWYVAGARHVYDGCETAGLPDEIICRLRAAQQDDGIAFRLSCETALATMEMAARTGRAAVPDVLLETMLWHATLSPFFIPCDASPFALVLDRAAVDELSDARISKEVRDYGRATVAEHGIAYIDIPHHAMPLGNGRLQLRAMVVATTEAPMRFYAMFSRPGENRSRRISWIEGGQAPLSDQLGNDEMVAFTEMMGRTAEPLPALKDVLADAGINQSSLLEELEDFAVLAITYAKTHMVENAAAWEELPHLPAGHPRRSGRKGRAVAKRFSLFRAFRIGATGLDRRSTISLPTGRTLGRRSRVCGHYRLQAHGPRWGLRKLRWIAPFMRGPRDGVPLTPILDFEEARREAGFQRDFVDAPAIYSEFDDGERIPHLAQPEV